MTDKHIFVWELFLPPCSDLFIYFADLPFPSVDVDWLARRRYITFKPWHHRKLYNFLIHLRDAKTIRVFQSFFGSPSDIITRYKSARGDSQSCSNLLSAAVKYLGTYFFYVRWHSSLENVLHYSVKLTSIPTTLPLGLIGQPTNFVGGILVYNPWWSFGECKFVDSIGNIY